MEIMTQKVQRDDLKKLVHKWIPDNTGKDSGKPCQPIHPVFIRKVKILNKPTFKLGKLIEFHYKGNSSGKALRDETGDKVEQTDGYEPRVQESA